VNAPGHAEECVSACRAVSFSAAGHDQSAIVDREAGDAGTRGQVPDLPEELTRDMEAHHEVDYVDVGHVCGAAEDGRYLESVDSAGVWDDPFAFSTEGKPGQKIPVLTVGCRQILLQPLGAGPRRPGHVGMHRRPFPRAPAAGTRSAPGRSSG